MRVLVAADDGLSRKILEDYLNSWGYDVVLARNGKEAWDILREDDRPNIAILDGVMPGMDGLEVCERLRSLTLPKYVYVIILTALSSIEDVVKGLVAGADDYIIKPFNHDELKYRLKIGERIIELEQRILCMASTDYLTGMLNRRAFMERLTGEINRARRQQISLGIIIADIDHFKRVNDNYGHQSGDLVLQEVAKLLLSSCRVYDFVGRYGGEEFIACLPAASIEETYAIAERMRQGLESQPIPLLDQHTKVSITASFGVTGISGGEASADELIRWADDALYKAKNNGRNQVVIYQ
ncbi:MAG: diguanylate cyclase [Syntrophomonadaceae bacterium]|nr:diguanylate cyclase [Syntrophomonadaceae bacterium]